MSIATRLSHEVALSLNGIDIKCRTEDGYINATKLCQDGGKRFKK
jgi:hypothetical protein